MNFVTCDEAAVAVLPGQRGDPIEVGDRGVQPSLDAIKAARESTASILAALSEAERERAGMHSEMGVYSIETWLEVYASG